MRIAATVVIPTHDHANLLPIAVNSVLAQTVSDIEVFVIGDGVSDDTRQAVETLQGRDSRIRFFDHPKSPRTGEPYRHLALIEARGDIVCYQADDDLWLPDHLEELQRLLRDADFAHTLPVQVLPDGALHSYTVDLSLAADRELTLAGTNRVPLGATGHTLDAYRRLPFGWRTTPAGIPTDLYMWQQFLSQPWCRFASGMRPTTLHFASPFRREWTAVARFTELERWSQNLNASAGRDEFQRAVLDSVARDRARQVIELRCAIDQSVRQLEELRVLLAATQAEQTTRQHEVDSLRHLLLNAQAETAEREHTLAARDARIAELVQALTITHNTITWRFRERLVRRPWLVRAVRWLETLARPRPTT